MSEERPEASRPAMPFEAWSEWLRTSVEGGRETPGVMVSPGEEAHAVRSSRSDPLVAAVEQAWASNPLQSVLPIDWAGITASLQTLWERQMRDPENASRAMRRAADFNLRAWSVAMESWNSAFSRLWGLDAKEGEEDSDKRFSALEWGSNPYYQTLRETYRLASEYLLQEVEEVGAGDPEEEHRLRFHLRQFVDAMAPVNFLLTNPEALRRVSETGGASVAEGTRNLLSDLRKGRLTITDPDAFEPGENLAITPGKVVHRNDLMELIQYAPKTDQVREVPMLWIPPWINKYYILDMQPKNSFVNYMVEQGFTVFVISWKNPDASMEETTFEDYMRLGPLEAADVVRDVTGSEQVNPMGYCIGGTLLAMTLAYLEAKGGDRENRFGPATFMVSLQDFSEVGDTSVFIDEEQVDFIEHQMLERGYLDGDSLYNMFNLLRPSSLIWSNVINNYLLGQDPPAFDLLYWNSDSTRMTRDAHSFYLRNTYLENNLIEPGKVELDGVPIDLSRIEQDLYAVGAEKDHIVPWGSAWRIGRLASGEARFVLASSGHIAGIINHPDNEKGVFWTSDAAGEPETPEEWFEQTEEHEGSWWNDWTAWLSDRSGKMVEPPSPGSEDHPPIEDAPGSYVREK